MPYSYMSIGKDFLITLIKFPFNHNCSGKAPLDYIEIKNHDFFATINFEVNQKNERSLGYLNPFNICIY